MFATLSRTINYIKSMQTCWTPTSWAPISVLHFVKVFKSHNIVVSNDEDNAYLPQP